MATFKDQNGREWVLSLDAPKIRAVRKECGLDLAAVDDRPYQRMYDDSVLLVDVLWVLCREQAQKSGTTDEQFGVALVGDAIDRATTAVLDAICDFFPSRKRAVLQTLAQKATKVHEMQMERALERLNDPTIEAAILKAMDEQTNAHLQAALIRLSSPKSAPESSESAPTA